MNTTESFPLLCMDIGGTKILSAIMQDGHTLVCQQERATLASEGRNAILKRVIELAQETIHRAKEELGQHPVAAGIASAGQIDPDSGEVLFATHSLPSWMGTPLAEILAASLGMSVFVDNDVNCFALAEAKLGAGRGLRHVLLAVVGTGIGGGIVINGEVYRGRRGGAGEIGQISLLPGGLYFNGLEGPLEACASTSAMLRNSGYPTIQALAADYAAGRAIPSVDEAAAWLGRGLAVSAHILAPDAILIGGSALLLGEQYLKTVRHAFMANTLSSHRPPLFATHFGADCGLMGAGLLAEGRIKNEKK